MDWVYQAKRANILAWKCFSFSIYSSPNVTRFSVQFLSLIFKILGKTFLWKLHNSCLNKIFFIQISFAVFTPSNIFFIFGKLRALWVPFHISNYLVSNNSSKNKSRRFLHFMNFYKIYSKIGVKTNKPTNLKNREFLKFQKNEIFRHSMRY